MVRGGRVSAAFNQGRRGQQTRGGRRGFDNSGGGGRGGYVTARAAYGGNYGGGGGGGGYNYQQSGRFGIFRGNSWNNRRPNTAFNRSRGFNSAGFTGRGGFRVANRGGNFGGRGGYAVTSRGRGAARGGRRFWTPAAANNADNAATSSPGGFRRRGARGGRGGRGSRGRGGRGGRGGRNTTMTAEELDRQLMDYMGEDAAKARLDNELDDFFGRGSIAAVAGRKPADVMAAGIADTTMDGSGATEGVACNVTL